MILQSSKKLIHSGVLITCLLLPSGFAQQQPPGGAGAQPAGGAAQPFSPALEGIRPTYLLGSGDQVILRAYMMEEISGTPYRINSEGDLTFPTLA